MMHNLQPGRMKTLVTSIQAMIKWSRKRYKWCCGIFCKNWTFDKKNDRQRGASGFIRNRKTEEKNRSKPEKNSIKTENRMQNRQNQYIFISQLL